MAAKTPTLLDVVTAAAATERVDIHTALPGRVVALNAADNTVTVEPMIKQVLVSGGVVDLPPLVDVPVQFPRGGGFVFTVPVGPGDEGLVAFSERCIDGWFASGDRAAPMDTRLHDLSDGFFLPGFSSRPHAIPELYLDGASMQTVDGDTYIRLSKGKITIKGDIEHVGNSKQTGNHEQAGDVNQTSGNSQSNGTVKAKKVIANGVDVEDHNHGGVQTGGGNTGKPNK